MKRIIWVFYFLVIIFLTINAQGEEIWKESFDIPDKGFWGDPDGTSIHTDMSGITKWQLNVSACLLTAENDYVKTTSTSGGRLEAMDCDGEAIWTSEPISIHNFKDISIKINLSETGSSSNTANKYIKVFYQIDDQPETIFENNGENAGNFGANLASQTGLNGEKLRVIIRMNNTYSSDKLIVDEILVEGESNIVLTAIHASIINCPDLVYTDNQFEITAQAICANGTVDLLYNKELFLTDQSGILNIGNSTQTPENGIYRWKNLSASQEGILSVLISNEELSPATKEIVVEKKYEPSYFFDFEDQQLNDWTPVNDWIISNEEKINGNFSLRHSPDATNSESVIFHPFDLSLTTADYRWNISLKNGNWIPSSSNRFWYYLAVDSSNPEDLNGWAVGINISGSNNMVELWRFKNGKPDSLIVQSDLKWEANAQIRLEVERRDRGQWSIGSRNLPGIKSTPVTGTDFSVFDFNFIGLHFDYTVSRAGQLWADDISLAEIPIPPFVQNLSVLDEDKLELTFNKEIDQASVKTESFKLISESGKLFSVLNASFIPETPDKIAITVEKPNEFNLKLLVSGISDKSGLLMEPDTLDFKWVLPCLEHSLVINEIFPDPYPSVGLPEYEYIELFNRMEVPASTKGLQLVIDEKQYELPDIAVAPGSFTVLTSTEGVGYLKNAVAIDNFPALRNSGADVRIKNKEGLTIDQVQYSNEWYGNDQFMDGGWSLERIDPNRFCGQENNWTASVNQAGGTPGTENSEKRDNIDQLPAEIVSLEVVSAIRLNVHFSEEVNSVCISNPNNYSLKDFDIHPDSLFAVNSKQVSLYFSQPFVSKVDYILEMLELIDLCGNSSINKSANFMLYEPEEHSLVITEVFADPYPTAGLSEYEYIEIFNRSDYPIQLNSIELQVEAKKFELGKNIIKSHEYLVLTSAEGSSLMSNSLSVPSFPALRNAEGSIQLIYHQTRLIDQLEYSDNWYHDSEKRDGGWSLERIDNDRFCGPAGNWTASIAQSGGTPGKINSVAANNQDSEKPEIIDLEVIASNRLKLVISENIVLSDLENTQNYTVTPAIGRPENIEIIDQHEIILILPENIAPNQDYQLQVSNLSDECGNAIENGIFEFELQQLKSEDVLISEVLFNPYPGGTDFVEIYNPSENPVNLKNLRIASRDEQNNITEVCMLSNYNRWMQPGEYALLTKDSLNVALFYYSACPECFCITDKFPSYSDDKGTVVLLSNSLQVIDEFRYSEKMHHPLIDDVEGVSLERLSFDAPSDNSANWHSAASTVGFATPGCANSQHREELPVEENIVLAPEVFSPNNDGFNDRLLIHFQLEKPGYSGNVKVYDSQGRLINYLVKNEILPQEGDWYWDGVKADDSRSSLGIYIVLVELFDMEGNVKKFRKTCTLTDRL